MERAANTPTFLPRPEHIAYLANLLTVLTILYLAWHTFQRSRATRKGNITGGPGWSASSV